MHYNRALSLLTVLCASPVIVAEFAPALMEYRGSYAVVCNYTGPGSLTGEDAAKLAASPPGSRARLFILWKTATDRNAESARGGAAFRAGVMFQEFTLANGTGVQAFFAYDNDPKSTAPFATLEKGSKGNTRNGHVLRDASNFAYALEQWIASGRPAPEAPPVEVRNGGNKPVRRLEGDAALALLGLTPAATADLASKLGEASDTATDAPATDAPAAPGVPPAVNLARNGKGGKIATTAAV